MTVRTREMCPNCGDSKEDNLVSFENGSKHCFACGWHGYHEKTLNKGFQYMTEPKLNLIENGLITDIKTRCLSKATCDKYNIQVSRFTGRLGSEQVRDHIVVIFNLYENGQLVKQKIRDPINRSLTTVRGDTKNATLMGMHAFNPHPEKYVVITEGEFDAASVYEATGYASLSITNGAEGASKQILQHRDWLHQWKQVILAFDNDAPGQKAIESCVSLFRPGKCRILHWPLKDANEMLMKGRGDEIKKLIYDAEEYRPYDLVTTSDILPDILKRPEIGPSWPWQSLTTITDGFRTKEISVLAGAPEQGKTEVVKDIMWHMINKHNINVGVFSFEQDAADTVIRLIGHDLERPLHIAGEWWDEDIIKQKSLFYNEKLWMYKRHQLQSIDDIFYKIEYLKIAKDCRFFVIDNLKAIQSLMANEIKETNTFMCRIKALSNDLDVHIMVLSHLAKDKKQAKVGQDDESWSRGREPVLENIYGSSAIEAWANYVFAISRNVHSENPEEQCITKFLILKSRHKGYRGGRLFYLIYDYNKGYLEELVI